MDDLQITIGFDDGSVGTVSYVTTANKRFPKETVDLLGGGKVARLDNFRSASLWAGRRKRALAGGPVGRQGPEGRARRPSSRRCGRAARCRSRCESLVAVTDATLAVSESVARGDTVKLGSRLS